MRPDSLPAASRKIWGRKITRALIRFDFSASHFSAPDSRKMQGRKITQPLVRSDFSANHLSAASRA
jgi:hypothetical protein